MGGELHWKIQVVREQVRVERRDLFQCFRAVVVEVGSGLLHAPERGDLEEVGEERRVPNERGGHTRRTRIGQGNAQIGRGDRPHVSEAVVDQERLDGQVEKVPLTHTDVGDARTGGRTEVERARLIEHGTGMTERADALRGAWSDLRLDEHQAAALL